MSRAASSAAAPASVAAGRLALLVAAGLVCVVAGVEPDIWGHLRFGLDVLESWRLPSVDPYSFTQDVPWVNHEWLSELLFALAFRTAGIAGLIGLKSAILAVSIALLVAASRPQQNAMLYWALAVVVINLSPAASTFRPQLWTILGLVLVCSMLVGRISLRWMPLTFLVWANMHGGWIVGAGVCALWIVGRTIDTRSVSSARAVIWASATGVLATLVNPYGTGLWRFLLTTVRASRPDITEWRPYWERYEAGHIILLPLAISLLIVTATYRRRYLTWAMTLPTVWLLVGGLSVARLAPLSAVLVGFCVSQAWATGGPLVAPSEPWFSPRRLIDGAILLAAVVPVISSQSRCLPIPERWGPDLLAASAFENASVTGRLVLPFDWGEFAIWHWGPRIKVSIDGRRETVYSDSMLTVQRAVAQGRPEGLAFLERTRPEFVWVQDPATPTLTWLNSHGYSVDIETEHSRVARRNDLPPLRPTTPMAACVP